MSGPTLTDDIGVKRITVHCVVFRDLNIHARPDASSATEGYLPTGANWFACQTLGMENPVTYNTESPSPHDKPNHNKWWLFTQSEDRGPDGRKLWGWFPATAVTEGEEYQPVPGVPVC
jgi:hypothetical protein